jgi:hypothetical protein
MAKTTYTSPVEFLKVLQEYHKYEPQIEGEGHAEFTRLNELQFKEIQKQNGHSDEYFRESNYLVESLFEMVAASMEADVLKKLRDQIAFGKVINTFCNAICVKSSDGKFAILIYEGLMQLLHKHGKLILASNYPDKVLSCSRGNPKDLKGEDYRLLAEELIENYKNFGTPIGAMIKFDLQFVISHAFNLTLQELFVLCHELGHFFNGDLENDQNFYSLTKYDWKIFDDNKDHLMEFKADLTGFAIFEKAVLTKYKMLPRKYLILPISQLFDILAILNSNPSNSHPAPIDRIMNIISYHFGEETAQEYLATYDSKEKLDEFFKLDMMQ